MEEEEKMNGGVCKTRRYRRKESTGERENERIEERTEVRKAKEEGEPKH